MSEIVAFAPAPSLFGFGALVKLPEELKSRGFRRLLVITDRQIASSGIMERVLDLLKGQFEVDVFEDAPNEPLSTDIDKLHKGFRSDADAFLGLGGGSTMDVAKALSIVMTHGGVLSDYEGEGTVPGPVIPIVCVPTTSGTGSQNTQTTVFTTRGVKLGCSSEYIRPALSIVDPELTLGLPASVTRNSGYDALMHAIESFTARPHGKVAERPILYQGSNPFSRTLALEAFRSIWAVYRRAVRHGEDREARGGMSLGSHLAGMAFSHSGLGLVHALASSLGGMVDAPHGVCLAACTTLGLSYNLTVCTGDFAVLGAIMEGKEYRPPSETLAGRFIENLEELIRDLNFPTRPSDLGVKKEDAQALLRNTLLQTRRIKTNPRPLEDDLLGHIQKGI